MKGRFLVFAYDDYYPLGGWEDLHERCDTLEEAEEEAAQSRKWADNVVIIDLSEDTAGGC
jgi:hypothetical protein